MIAAPFDSTEADKFQAAFQRKSRTGLGFSSTTTTSVSPSNSTEATRCLLSNPPTSASFSSSTSSSFSAEAYLTRFGWKEGGGLGKKEDGVQSFLRVSKKADTAGVGAGPAMQAVARSFESLFNNAANNISITVCDQDTEEEEEEEDSGEKEEKKKREEETRKEKKRAKKRRKAEKREREGGLKDPAPVQVESPPSSTLPETEGRDIDPSRSTPLHPLHHRAFVRSSDVLLPNASSRSSSSASSSSPSSLPIFAAELVSAYDPQRAPLYHDRCQGKMARLRAQEEKHAEIVEQVRKKRWEDSEERKEISPVESFGEVQCPIEGNQQGQRRRRRDRQQGDSSLS